MKDYGKKMETLSINLHKIQTMLDQEDKSSLITWEFVHIEISELFLRETEIEI
jgi:hypothetical protein